MSSANMGLIPTDKCIEAMSAAFPKDSEVEVVYMYDPNQNTPKGTKGKVIRIDNMGMIHVAWEDQQPRSVLWNEDVVKNTKTGVMSNSFWQDNRPIAAL